MYVKSRNIEEINFLASAKYLCFTREISDTGVTANSEGRKIVQGGTVYKNSNDVAIGLLLTDIDVTEAPQPGAVIYEGWVLESRLPKAITAEEKATMTGIKFKDSYEDQEAAEDDNQEQT